MTLQVLMMIIQSSNSHICVPSLARLIACPLRAHACPHEREKQPDRHMLHVVHHPVAGDGMLDFAIMIHAGTAE